METVSWSPEPVASDGVAMSVANNQINAAGSTGTGIYLYDNPDSSNPVVIENNAVSATTASGATGICVSDSGAPFGDSTLAADYATLTGNTLSNLATGIEVASPNGQTVSATATSNAANTSGTDIEGGTLLVGGSSGLGSGALVVNGGILDLDGSDLDTGPLSGSGGVITDNGAAAGTSTLIVDQSFNGSYSGVIQDGAARQVALTVAGPATLTLTGEDTFSGPTAIDQGAIRLGNSNALQNSMVSVNVNGGLLFSSGLGPADLDGLEGTGNLALQDASGQPIALSVGNNNADTSYGGVLSGTGSLDKTGCGTLTLTAPGIAGVTIVDPDNLVIAAGVVSFTSPTVMVGMPLMLTATVADPFGQCQGVSFYIDVNGTGVVQSGDTLLGAATDQGGIWSLTVSTTGWSPSTATGFTPSTQNVIAQATFAAGSPHAAPAATSALANLNVTGDAEWAIISSSEANVPPGHPNIQTPTYSESAAGSFAWVDSSSAYGGKYRLGGGSGAYVTYTFTGLAPGNYEIWDQFVANASYPTDVVASVYDGTTNGTLLQTFGMDETSSDNWPSWSFEGISGFGWSQNNVYCNSGTITVKVNCSAAHTEAPTIVLIGDPESGTSSGVGAAGGPEVSSTDPVTFADGGIQPDSSVASAPPGAAYSNVDQTLTSGIFGYGGRTDDTPELIGDGMLVEAVNVPDPSPGPDSCCGQGPVKTMFKEPDRNYQPMYGTQYTLTDNGTNLVLTAPDGTLWTFSDPAPGQAYATGQWQKTVLPDGQTTVASFSGTQMTGINSYASPSATQQSTEAEYTYYESTNLVNGVSETVDPEDVGLCASITYLDWNSGTLVNTEQVTYTYYGDGSPGDTDSTGAEQGLPGDLKTVTTSYWNAASDSFTGGQTYYYRYYTGSSSVGFAHGLKLETEPAAYSQMLTAADTAYPAYPADTVDKQLTAIAGLPDSTIESDSSYQYTYDTFDRVTSEIASGGLRTETFSYTEGSDSQSDTNAWARRTVEGFLDGNTETVYTNYLGQTILDDVWDAASQQHTYTYYEYDAYGDVVLDASSSAIDGYNDGDANYAGDGRTAGQGRVVGDGPTANFNDFHIQLGITRTGSVQESSYRYVTVSEFHTSAGLLKATWVADGLVFPSVAGTGNYPGEDSNSYYNSTAVLKESYTYGTQTGTDGSGPSETIYPEATDTTYTTATSTLSSTDSAATPTTTTTDTYYAGTLQPKTVVTTQPLVGNGENGTPQQNGTGTAAKTIDYYDQQGNLAWSEDANGYLTYNDYDSTTGLLLETIANVNSTTVLPSGVSLPTGVGLSFPTQNGPSETTNYYYDSQQNLDETLGPMHQVDGQNVRTASWTYNDSADNTTYSAQGYATYTSAGASTPASYTLVNPVSVEITDADGNVNDDIKAALAFATEWGTPSSPAEVSLGSTPGCDVFASIGAPSQANGNYVSWTHDTYQNSQLASTEDYYAIPSSGAGTSTANYNQTTYGYDSEGQQMWTESPGGTYTWNVLDANGNVTSTWKGTNHTTATDALPDGSGNAGVRSASDTSWESTGNEFNSTSGTSLAFNGAGAVDVAHNDLYSPVTGMTVGLWVKVTTLPASGHSSYLVDAGGKYDLNVGADGTVYWQMDINGTLQTLDSNVTLTAGSWHSVVAQYNPAGELLLSIDGGTPVEMSVTGTPNWAATGDFILGASAASGANGLVGNLADVCLYGQVLSPSDISGASSSAALDSLDPVAHWCLDGGAGTSVPGNGGNNMVEMSSSVYNADGLSVMDFKQTANLQDASTPVAAGTVAVSSTTSGPGYLMYSGQNVQSRFSGVPTGDSASFVAVAYVNGQWEYDNGSELEPFTPLLTDVLVASVNFGATLSTPTPCFNEANTVVDGIAQGYGGSTPTTDSLTYGVSNPPAHSLTVSGTSFVENLSPSVTQYGYDSRDRQVYVVNPPDASGNITYTLTTYDNQDQVTETQQYLYKGDPSVLPGILAAPAADPPGLLSANDVLLTQSTSSYDTNGQVYQTADYIVTDGQPGHVQTTAETTNTWYDADGNQVKTEDALGNYTTYSYDGLGQQTTVTQPAWQAGTQPVTQTVYDADGNVTATIDPLGRVTATGYDGTDRQVASYQGQVMNDSGPSYSISTGSNTTATWTFSNLSPSNWLTYDIYVDMGSSDAGLEADYSAADGDGTFTRASDLTDTPLGTGWYDLGTVAVLASTSAVTVTYSVTGAGTPASGVCILQQTSATAYDAAGNVSTTTDALGSVTTNSYDALGQETSVSQPAAQSGQHPVTQTIYDADGNVTATIDPLGRVTASFYDEFGQVTDGYQGQVITNSDPVGYSPSPNPAWTFSNLTPSNVASGSALTYDVYVDSAADTGSYGFDRATISADPTAPSLGGDWKLLCTVTLDSASASALTVTYLGTASGTAVPYEVSLLQKTSHTVYDLEGDVISTTDALGNVTTNTYDNLGRQTAVAAPDPANGLDDTGGPVTQTVYDAAGNVSATIDPLGRVTAASYDSLGQETAGYQGQIITNTAPPSEYAPGSNPTWTFSNLAPSNWLCYYVYVNSTSDLTLGHYTVDENGDPVSFAPNNDPTAPTSLGAGWTLLGTVMVSDSTSVVAVSHAAGEAPDEICLLQQTSATAYDLNGNVTAKTDALGHVTASSYDALGQNIAGYQGHVVNSLSGAPGYTAPVVSPASPASWTFSNLTPNDSLSYEVYVDTGTEPGGGYTVTSGDTLTAATHPTDTPLGAGWYDLGTVTVPASATALSVFFGSGATPTAVCLVQQTTTTAYDLDGEVTATIDPLNRVTASAYDSAGRAIADYQGQIIDTGGAGYTGSGSGSGTVSSWAFTNLSPNNSLSYDVYVCSATPPSDTYTVVNGSATSLNFATVADPTAPSLGAGWYLLGTVTDPASTSALTVGYTGAPPTAVCLMQQTSATAYDADGHVISKTDALGETTTYGYDNLGEQTASDQGQIVNTLPGAPGYTASNWSFANVSPSAIGGSKVDVYIYSATTPASGWQADYNVTTSGATLNDSDPVATTTAPGGGWYYLGSVTLASGITAFSVTEQSGDPLPGAVCLLQEAGATTYDLDGKQANVTDSDGNTTAYVYDSLGRLVSETQPVQLSYGAEPTTAETTWQYDADGELLEKTDADGQVTKDSYDSLGRVITETWYRAGSGTSYDTLNYTYDLDGELLTANDDVSSYACTYNSVGQETSVDNNGTPGVPDVALTSSYDADGDRTQLAATIGSTADFVNNYSYDNLNRETQVTQGASAASGADAVDPKLVNFTYEADGQLASIDRFHDLTATPTDRVATSTYGYDSLGRLTSLTHTAAATTTYGWTYDADDEVTSFANSAHTDENVGSYGYDSSGQLVSATAAGGSENDNASNSLANSYDADGNATSINGGAPTSIGAGNTVLFDGTYSYQYDADGNVTARWNSSVAEAQPSTGDTNITIYTWDNRNRLTAVTSYATYADYTATTPTPSQTIAYTYDIFDNLIGRKDTTYNTDGSVAASTAQRYVFDGANMVLAFDGNQNLTDRYLWGPAVDQVLADENFVAGSHGESGNNGLPTSPGTTLWALGDNQNSVRDVVENDGTLEQHIAYSPFGQQVSGLTTTGSVVANFAFGYTGTYTDPLTGFQLHGVRWYDPASQRWLSQDPTGLAAGPNYYSYCGNAPTGAVDLSGMDDGPVPMPWVWQRQFSGWTREFQVRGLLFGHVDASASIELGKTVVTERCYPNRDLAGGDVTVDVSSTLDLKLHTTVRYVWSDCFGGRMASFGAEISVGMNLHAPLSLHGDFRWNGGTSPVGIVTLSSRTAEANVDANAKTWGCLVGYCAGAIAAFHATVSFDVSLGIGVDTLLWYNLCVPKYYVSSAAVGMRGWVQRPGEDRQWGPIHGYGDTSRLQWD